MILRRSHARFARALLCLALTALAPLLRATELTAPRAPAGSRILSAEAAEILTRPTAWLTPTPFGQSLHLHGAAEVRFSLSSLRLTPGYYRLGLLARTGTRWTDANGQIAHYRWQLLPAASSPPAPPAESFALLDSPGFPTIRESGEPDSWANWYGTLQAPRPLRLRGDEAITITNLENHGGVLALWIQPVDPLNAARLTLRIDAPNHAFIHGTTPAVHVQLQLPADLPRTDATLALEWFDLLTDRSTTDRSAVRLEPGKPLDLALTPALKPGVYRLRATLESSASAGAAPTTPSSAASATPSANNPSSAHLLFAVSPARPAADLPDDWPLGAHVTPTIPPLPGFRWYRYFAQWPEIHTAPGRYDWTTFDSVFAAVKAVNGRLLIASDGSPTWTSSRGKIGIAWSAPATAYPPDDWTVFRDYLTALVARYHDARGTLGALELCNEANTEDRWRGDTAQMLAMARVFQDVTKNARPPIQTIGFSVSAGDQRSYVTTLARAGLPALVDAASAHFYEELMSPELATPINNLPRHVAMLSEPLHAAGHDLPLINTECGIGFAPRINGHAPTQDQLNAAARAVPPFDAKQPWLLNASVWRPVSERRAAATYVSGIVQLMALGVRQSYVFSQLELMIDGAPSLPWVALGRLGDALHDVDYHTIRPLVARYPGSDEKDGSPKALAYLLGRPGQRQVIIAWGFLSDTTVGRSKHWQRWLDPQPLRIETSITTAVLTDLYARTSSGLRATAGALEFPCGEEPVFLEISPAKK